MTISSDILVMVVVALAAISLYTTVASLLTNCSSSNCSSNATSYSDRASYSCVYCVGAGVGGIDLQEKGSSRRELVLSKPLCLDLRFLARVTMPNWSPNLFYVASQDWLARTSHSSNKLSLKRLLRYICWKK